MRHLFCKFFRSRPKLEHDTSTGVASELLDPERESEAMDINRLDLLYHDKQRRSSDEQE